MSDNDGKSVAEAIRRGCGMGVSDGLFKDRFGTACWIIKAQDQESDGILMCGTRW